MVWAAIAVAIFLLVIAVNGIRRRGAHPRLLGPAGFRRALDAMSPDAAHRARTIEHSPPQEPLVSSIDPRPRADDPADGKEHPSP